MIENFSYKLTRHPKLVAIIAILLLIPSFFGVVATKVNYDILNYLPPDLESSKGEVFLEEPFKDAATSMLIVENMPPVYTERLLSSIKDIPGVNNAVWVSDLLGIQIPTELLPSNLRDIFFSGDSTMMIIQYEHPGASEETMVAIDKVRSLCNKNCFLAGFSVVIKDTRDLVDHEIPIFILLAVILSFFAMSLTFESWLLPLIFLAGIGMAVIYNFGTNIFMGQISYITKAIAAVLQLGVTMDYSIFLYRRYQEEKPKFDDNKNAMAHAVQTALTSLSGSSLTTIAGFLALCFMQLLLGKDIGIVMAKGVVLGVLTVILVLPAFLLIFDKQIERYRHRSLLPEFDKINTSIINHSKIYLAVSLVLFIPALYSQNHTNVYYKLDEALPQNMPSIVANNKLKDDYNMATTHFVILNNSLKSMDMNAIEEQIKNLDGIEEVISYNNILGTGIPDFFVPDEVREMLKQGDLQLMVINSSYATASNEISEQLKEIRSIIKSYDPSAYITGESALTDDLITTASVDFKVTN
ncbi:MAG: MMPL family transporter [Lachnospiraceae bacterium]|nr:MMPL family transporter [Lachnospiraceae bacterium]